MPEVGARALGEQL